MRQQPVLTGGIIVGAILAIVTFLVAMGYITMDTEQVSAFEAMLWAVVPLLLPIGAAYLASRQVTPVANPRNNDGVKLVPETEEAA